MATKFSLFFPKGSDLNSILKTELETSEKKCGILPFIWGKILGKWKAFVMVHS